MKDKTKQNYIVKDGNKYTIYLNKYKNSKFLGSREYPVDKKLTKILDIWFKFNKSKFLLTKTDRERMLGSNSLTKLLTKLFERELGKKISTSMMRHIRSTEDNKDSTTILEDEQKEKEIEQKYLHSASMNKKYAKVK
jgi:integrase